MQEADNQTPRSEALTPENAAQRVAAHQSGSGPDDIIEFISFSIGDDQYGVEIIAVREIKGWSDVTHLPRQPDYVRGVLNLRGVMVPIIDLRCRFGQGVTEARPMHVVIIVQIGDKLGRHSGGPRARHRVGRDRKIQPVPKVAGRAQPISCPALSPSRTR